MDKSKLSGLFCTVMGHSVEIEFSDGSKIVVGKVGVWADDRSKGKPQVVKTFGSLAQAFDEFGEIPVFHIGQGVGRS